MIKVKKVRVSSLLIPDYLLLDIQTFIAHVGAKSLPEFLSCDLKWIDTARYPDRV